MADKELIDTVIGKFHKFDIFKQSTVGSIKFWIYKDGKPFRGPYSDLLDAEKAAEKEVCVANCYSCCYG